MAFVLVGWPVADPPVLTLPGYLVAGIVAVFHVRTVHGHDPADPDRGPSFELAIPVDVLLVYFRTELHSCSQNIDRTTSGPVHLGPRLVVHSTRTTGYPDQLVVVHLPPVVGPVHFLRDGLADTPEGGSGLANHLKIIVF